MEVRAAVSTDASAIGDAHAEAWRVGFAGLSDPTWLEEAVEERRHRWDRSLAESVGAGQQVIVAESNGLVMGFTHLGPAEEDPGLGEVFALYVRPDYWGTGTAQALTRHARARLRSMGFQKVVFWTPSRASRARAFYENDGWSLTVKTRDRDFGDGRLHQLDQYASPA